MRGRNTATGAYKGCIGESLSGFVTIGVSSRFARNLRHEHDVLWLYIAVNDGRIPRVKVREAERRVGCDPPPPIVPLDVLLADPVVERTSPCVLQDQAHLVVSLCPYAAVKVDLSDACGEEEEGGEEEEEEEEKEEEEEEEQYRRSVCKKSFCC